MSSAARLHAHLGVQVNEGAWPRLQPQLPQQFQFHWYGYVGVSQSRYVGMSQSRYVAVSQSRWYVGMSQSRWYVGVSQS